MKKIIGCLILITIFTGIASANLAYEQYIPQKGDLIKTNDMPAVYYINSLGEKHLFVNGVTFWTWYTGTWSDQNIITILQDDFDNLPTGNNITVHPGTKLIKFENSEKIYTVNLNRTIRELVDEEIASYAYGHDYLEEVITIQTSFETDYTIGSAINLSSELPLGESEIDIETELGITEPEPKPTPTPIDNRPDYSAADIFQDMDLNYRITNKGLTLRSTTKNIGNEWSPNEELKITWYVARFLTSPDIIDWEKIATINLEEFEEGKTVVNSTKNYTPKKAQDYLFKFVIDENNSIDEIDESNNEIQKRVTIRGSGSTTIQTPSSNLKNIIVFIGDGMGSEHVKAASMYKTGNEGSLSFESFPYNASVTTYSADSSITDSAAAGTAMATGQKVNSGVVSVALPGDGSDIQTILEYYKLQGKSTGLITTTYMTHATPASFGAHESDRESMSAIAQDYLTQTMPNILLGGGGNGMDESSAISAGYTVVSDRDALLAIDTSSVSMLSGQFGTTNLPYEYDGLEDLPHLSDMTSVALDILNNDSDGFFAVIEGGKIDHAAHDNDIERTVQEMIEFENAIDVVYDWASSRNDTLIIVTADHETGGLTVDQNNGINVYPTVSWSSGGHTALNIPIYAWGEGADQFSGTIDNTDIYTKIKQ
jgi:alkaline phosphatase